MDFLQGASASIFATFIIYISRNIWRNWWHLLLSKNYPKVNGRYRIKEDLSDYEVEYWYKEEKQIVDFKQYGKHINGQFEIYDGDTLKHKFPLSGTVGLDRSILMKYESNDPKYTAKGSLLVRFKGLEGNITGEHIFICLNCEKIHVLSVGLDKLGKCT